MREHRQRRGRRVVDWEGDLRRVHGGGAHGLEQRLGQLVRGLRRLRLHRERHVLRVRRRRRQRRALAVPRHVHDVPDERPRRPEDPDVPHRARRRGALGLVGQGRAEVDDDVGEATLQLRGRLHRADDVRGPGGLREHPHHRPRRDGGPRHVQRPRRVRRWRVRVRLRLRSALHRTGRVRRGNADRRADAGAHLARAQRAAATVRRRRRRLPRQRRQQHAPVVQRDIARGRVDADRRHAAQLGVRLDDRAD